jgi:hypothetical protein
MQLFSSVRSQGCLQHHRAGRQDRLTYRRRDSSMAPAGKSTIANFDSGTVVKILVFTSKNLTQENGGP